MKINIYGFLPEETIESMPHGSQRFCFFQNIFITRKNVFIPFGLDVYKSPEALAQIYGDCPYFLVNRKADGTYSLNFGIIFDNFYFPLFPTSLEQILWNDDNFLRLKNEYFEINILEKVPIPITYDLHTQLEAAIENEEFEEAARIRDLIEKENKKGGQ